MTKTTCSVDDCASQHWAQGLCGKHYRASKRSSPCSIEGCGRGQVARGWCFAHWTRWKEHGDPMAGKPLRTTNGVPRSFVEEAATYEGDQCLEWPYAKNDKGYGQLQVGGRRVYAHRFVLELVSGPPPSEAMEAAHAPLVCHNPACVNPQHLRWATISENSRDRLLDGTFNGFRKPGNPTL